MPFAKPLPEALDELYAAFADVPKPESIEYCDHCLSAEEIDALLGWPQVRTIPAAVIERYTRKLTVWTAGSPQDAHYYLPRMVEIAAADRGAWPELSALCRFLSSMMDELAPRERSALGDFFRALWHYRLTVDGLDHLPDAAAVLCAADSLVDDVGPFLQLWEALLPQPAAVAQLAALLRRADLEKGGLRLPDAWADGTDDRVGAWLARVEIRDAVTGASGTRPDDDDALFVIGALDWVASVPDREL